jgi:tripartite-type tricarboxylate transporter receptor subunit TctC
MMLSRAAKLGAGTVLGIALSLNAIEAGAQDANAFFDGRQVRIVVGADAGGGYDTYARFVARHYGNHLPGKGANFVVQNMAGAGSIVAMNHLYNVAPKDGSVLGAINPGSIAEPLFSPDKAKYDPRQFAWIGSVMRDTEVILTWHESPIKKFDDLFKTEMLSGSTGGSSAASTLPRLINGLLGTHLKLIEGYKGANDIVLAMERGEVQGYGSASWSGIRNSQTRLLNDKKLVVIAQYGLVPHPDLSGIPAVVTYAKNDEQRAIMRLMLTRQEVGRPFLAPPGTLDAIVVAYRKGFDQMVKDPAFVEEIKARNLDLAPATGAETSAMVNGIFEVSDAMVQQVKTFLSVK